MTTAITPLHYSLRSPAQHRRRPQKMASMRLPHDLSAAATGVALEIFADCTNAGLPFQDALLAIYLSGLEHGRAIFLPAAQAEHRSSESEKP